MNIDYTLPKNDRRAAKPETFKAWLFSVALSSALTFGATIMFAAPVMLDNEDIKAFWGEVLASEQVSSAHTGSGYASK